MPMTYAELVRFERSLRDQTVLGVYVNGGTADPAARRVWRVDLRHAFADVESWLRDAPHADKEAFAAARDLAWAQLDLYPNGIPAPAWAGFFSARRVHHVGVLTAAVPTAAIWSTGASVTPYLRALKEARPVIVCLADSRKARIYRYLNREAEFLEAVRAEVVIDEATHLGRPPRAGFHTGTRGRTATDAAQRELLKGTDLLLGETASRIAALDGGSAWVVLGGIPTVAAALLGRLAPDGAARATVVAGLDVHATEAQIAECARDEASRLRAAAQSAEIDLTIGGAASGGHGVTGSVDTMRALEEGRARNVYLTSRFAERSAADAQLAIRRAFDAGSVVEHVSGDAATRLDAAGGIAARLRYVTAPLGA